MVNQLLTNGIVLYPNKLFLNRKIRIGIVGSGTIAREHAKVVKSFNHTIIFLVTKTKSKKSLGFIREFNISKHFTNLNIAIKKSKEIDAWIVATPWEVNTKILKKLLDQPKPILIEKPILLKSGDIKKIISLYKKANLKKIHIAYNRNFYDFIPVVVKNLIKKNNFIVQANLSDTYNQIIRKRGNKIEPHLVKYITSHWISFIYIICKNLNLKINFIKHKRENSKLASIKYLLTKKTSKKTINYLNINFIPNCPKNLSIEFFMEDLYFLISPLEEMRIYDKINLVKNKNENSYKQILKKEYKLDKKFKPGFRSQYYEFISTAVTRKHSQLYSTNFIDLYYINKMCENLE